MNVGSSVFSGEPLPVAPLSQDNELDSFHRKLLDYLRRLSVKLAMRDTQGSRDPVTLTAVAPLAGGGLLNVDRSVTTSMNTNRLIGRSTAGVGVMEEVSVGTGLTLAANVLSATGGAFQIVAAGVATITGSGAVTIPCAQVSATNSAIIFSWQYPLVAAGVPELYLQSINPGVEFTVNNDAGAAWAGSTISYTVINF